MDPTTLVGDMIEDGRRIIEQLPQDGFEVTAAFWLSHYGYTPTIVERAPALLVGGYKIDVRGAALQVLKRMGVHDAVAAAHTDMRGAELVDKQGNAVAFTTTMPVEAST